MVVRNRAWDTVQGGFVLWQTEFPDTLGVQYPGPGTFGVDTSDLCVSGGRAVVEGAASLPDTTFNPNFLWPLNGGLGEVVGPGPMALDSGTEQYADGPVPGSQSGLFDGSTILARPSHDASLIITGDITMSALVYPTSFPAGFHDILEFSGGPADDEPNNAIWQMGVNGTDVFYAHEFGAGTNQTFIFTGATLALNTWTHVLMVRDDAAKTVTLYLNGVAFATVYTYTSTATGGTTSRASISGFWPSNIQQWNGRISSVKLIPRKLAQAEVIAEYKRWLPEAQR